MRWCLPTRLVESPSGVKAAITLNTLEGCSPGFLELAAQCSAPVTPWTDADGVEWVEVAEALAALDEVDGFREAHYLATAPGLGS